MPPHSHIFGDAHRTVYTQYTGLSTYGMYITRGTVHIAQKIQHDAPGCIAAAAARQ